MPSRRDIEAGRAYVLLKIRDELQRGLRRASASLNAFGDKAARIGLGATAAAVGIGLPIAAATKTYADFDDVMRKVKARSAGTEEQMTALRDQTKMLGRTTSFTAAQVAELNAILARRGRTRPQIMEQTPAILNLARAAGEGKDALEDIGLAASLSAGVIDAWGMPASKVTQNADLMTAAVNASALSMESLQDSLRYVAPLAAQSGLSFKQTLSTLGQLSNLWIEASTGGTAFRRMMIQLVAETEKLTGKRIEVKAEGGGFRDLPDIMQDLSEATKDIDMVDRLRIFEDIFGARGIAAAAGLSQARESTERLNAALDNAAGAAKRTADEMDAGIGGTKRRIESAMEGVKLAIGEAMEPLVTAMETDITGALGNLTQFIERNKTVVQGIAKGAVILGAVGVSLLAVGIAAKVAAFGISTVGGAVAMVTGIASRVGRLLTAPFRLASSAAKFATNQVIRFGGAARSSAGIAVAMFSRLPGAMMAAASVGSRAGSMMFGPIIRHGSLATAAISGRVFGGMMTAGQWAFRAVTIDAKKNWAIIRTTFSPAYLRATWESMRQSARTSLLGIKANLLNLRQLIRTTFSREYLRATLTSIGTYAKATMLGIGHTIRVAVHSPLRRIGTIGIAAFGRLRTVGMATIASLGRGMATVSGRLGGAIGGAAGLAGMAGAFGIGGAFAPILMAAPLVVAAFGSIGTAVGAVLSPLGLLAAAIGTGAVLWFKYSNSGQEALESLKTGFASYKSIGVDAFQGIRAAIQNNDWKGAAEIAFTALKAAWFQGIADIMEKWGGFIRAVVETFAGAMNSIARLWVTTQGKISKGILSLAEKEGVVGDVMAKLLGVDIREKAQKEKRVQQQRGALSFRAQEQRRQMEEARAAGKTEEAAGWQAELNKTLAMMQQEGAGLSAKDLAVAGPGEAIAAIDQQTKTALAGIDEATSGFLDSFRQFAETAGRRAEEAREKLAEQAGAQVKERDISERVDEVFGKDKAEAWKQFADEYSQKIAEDRRKEMETKKEETEKVAAGVSAGTMQGRNIQQIFGIADDSLQKQQLHQQQMAAKHLASIERKFGRQYAYT
jgi:TP901 family phage tail tape measure protein